MRFQLTVKSFLFATFFVMSAVANATDYYVSASGNDSNNGTSQATPWKSISKVESVCNAGTIHAGDRILFKCGDQFIGKAVIASIWGHSAHSGTATSPITLGAYGTGAKPVFLYPTGGSTAPEDRVLFWFAGVDYWVVDGLNFTDLDVTNNKVTPANCGVPLYLGSDVGCNHWTIQNVDISLCGMGIVLVGDYNTVQNCSLTNFKNLKSTPNTGGSTAYEDYGANPFTLLDGNYNSIKNNYVTGGWAESLDFGFNGGFCEMFGSCSNNSFMYNTIIDCNGLSEFGANGATANSTNNLYAYNKLIDNGAMFYCNISGPFACQVGNVQFYNNTVVETNNSRFAQGSANAGAGVTSPEAISHINLDSYMFLYNGTPTASTVYALKNNIFNILNPLKICRTSETRLTHDYEVFKLSGGSSVGLSLNSHEVSTTAAVFTNTSPSNAINWDLNLPAASPAVDKGVSVGISTDFVGTPVPAVPNAGIFETVTGSSNLAAASTATAISCNGGTSTVTVTATGGTAPYTGTGTFTVSAGSYSYTVTDAAGTSRTTSVTVTQPAAIDVALSSGTITVYGGTTTLTVSASGGTSGYTYKLNSGSYQSANTFSNVAAGTHTITAKDANGCTALQTITITQPAAPAQLVASSTSGQINCNGGFATVTVSCSGGVAPYSGTGDFSVTAGTYTYTVTDAAGTSTTTAITITQPTAIAVTLNSGTIAVYGGTTYITVNASGGSGGYNYKLNNGTYQSSNNFTGIAAGTYNMIVKDVNGCTKTTSINITQPNQLIASATATSINCNGASATVTVSGSGGVTPYSGTGTFNVNAGTYTYTVTDASGTTATTTITVSQPTMIAATLSSGTIAEYGGTTSLTVNAAGGTGSYTYKLNNGSYQSSNTFLNVSAGTYTVVVKDANGCTKTTSVTITQPNLLTASAAATSITCHGGTATVTVSAAGGISPYTGTGIFTVNAGTYSYSITDANGASATTSLTIVEPDAILPSLSSGTIPVYGGTTTLTVNASGGTGSYTYKLNNGSYQSSNAFLNVSAGTYTVTVKDANGCTAVQTITITQPAAPAQLVASSTAPTINCNGGTTDITVSASGGVAPYTGTGTFTVSAGIYNYTVTDANGTSAITSITVTQPSAIAVTISAGTIAIYGGTTSVIVNATGGTGTYSFKLDNGSYQSSNTFTGVAAGSHAVTVKDANSCTSVKTFTISQPAAPAQLIASSSAGVISCNGGNATVLVSATGGVEPYTGTGSFNVIAGTYSYTVTDASGTTATTAITVIQPSAINVTLSAGTITIYGGTTAVTVNASGGSGVYTYQLDGGNFQSSNLFGVVPAGQHTATVKDANGCTSVQTITLTQPAQNTLAVTATATAITCNAQISTILISASGGTAPYSGTGYFTGYAGTYSYTVTDASGASASTTITLTQPTAIVVSVTAAAITTTGGTTTVVVNASGGSSGVYSYQVNGGAFQSSNSFSNVAAGIYVINVKDANGCTGVYTLTLADPGAGNFKISLISKTNATCQGSFTGSIQVLASNGRAPYQYKLNSGRYASDRVFNNLKTGIYRVTAKDANGNTVSLVTYIYDGRTVCSTPGINGRELSVTAYPNPTTDRFSVSIGGSNSSDVTVEVMNIYGTKVYEEKGSASKNYVFGNNFPAGTYFVRITQGQEVKTTTVIKAK